MTSFRFFFVGLLLSAGSSFFSSYAMANGMGKIAGTYSSHTSTDGGGSSKASRMIYDVGAYYKFQGGGWVAGALYQNDSASGDLSANRTSYGASAGWMSPRESGFFVIGTYFISSTYEEFKDGTGYQIDVGYKFTPRQIPFGLQLSYKNYDYSKYDHSDTFIDPYFLMILNF